MLNAIALPTTFYEADIRRFARDWLAAARCCTFFNNRDPFDSDTMHEMVRTTLTNLADMHERNAARIVDLALSGAEDAHHGLMNLITIRTAAGMPIGPALATYVNIIGDRAPRFRMPKCKPPANFLENFIIICLIIALKRQFPELNLRRSTRKRPSLCSLTSETLIEAGLNRGSEEAIRKIWRDYGPLVLPNYHIKSSQT